MSEEMSQRSSTGDSIIEYILENRLKVSSRCGFLCNGSRSPSQAHLAFPFLFVFVCVHQSLHRGEMTLRRRERGGWDVRDSLERAEEGREWPLRRVLLMKLTRNNSQ